MDTNDETPTTEQPTQVVPETPPPSPTLMRSNDDRLIAGVCGGIAERYGVDVGFVRILAVILALIGGVTVFAYLAAVLLLPQNDGQGNPIERVRYRRLAQLAGFAAIGIAVLMLLGTGIGADTAVFWPSFGGAVACLVVVALAVAVGRRLRTPAPGRPAAPPLGRALGITLLILGVCVASVVLVGMSAIVTALGGAVPAAIAVLVLGLAMLALAASGRHALWLALPALAIAAPATLLAAGDVRIDDSAGERQFAPVTEAAVLPLYKLGVGAVEVDLRRMEWPKGRPLVVRMEVGLGEARVVVPAGVCVRSDSHIKLGEELILGEAWTGASLNEPRGQLDRWRGPKLLVEADIEVGQLVVARRSWDDEGGPDSTFDEDWEGREMPAITPAMAAAGCAGRASR